MSSHRYCDQDFKQAVASSFSIAEVLRKLGLVGRGGSYATFRLRVKKLCLDISHFTGQAHLKGKTHQYVELIPLTDILVAGSSRALTSKIKKRLIDQGLLSNVCSQCNLKDNWNNRPIVLQIDHINGDRFDHRLENLRLLCPNCHSQTDTFCSKNKTNYLQNQESQFVPQYVKPTCLDCGKELKNNRYLRCRACDLVLRQK